ncbi:unnamed protein product [Allacma fusca]|uniref:Uncharacterized protein n=1 Tax=Allacma fusca TaxID=39272 RepID=A0A8J2Q770_9HEXA|nr:unnamed protein product [Allacma fusca]
MSTAPRVDDQTYPWKRKSNETNVSYFEPAPGTREQNNNEQEKPPPRPPPPASGFPYEQHEFHPRPSEAKPRSGHGFFYAVFGTRQLAQDDGREAYIRVTIRELLIYIVYLALTCILTFGTTSSSSYYFTKVMMDLFVDQQIRPETKSFMTFRESITLDDFWDFVEGPMLDNLYQQFLYNDGVVTSAPPATTPQVTTNGVLFENKLIGVPRLRQIRVRPDSCEIAPNFRQLIRQCYGEYSQDAEDTTLHWRPLPGSAWTYFTESQLYGSSYWGKFATYSGAGSYLDLRIDTVPPTPPGGTPQPSAKDITREDIKILKRKHWITRATRVIFLDFSVYNANTNLFCFVKLIWEVPPTGGVITSWNIQTATLLRYNNWYDLYIILPCEILFCIFTSYYLIQEFYEMCYEGFRRYLKDIWSYVDISILIFSFICIAFSIVRHIVVQQEIERLKIHKGVFYPMEKNNGSIISYIIPVCC